jgi:cell division protein FtsZ
MRTIEGSNLSPAKIKVIGLGGGGCNAVNRMVKEGIYGIDFTAINTDTQALHSIEVPRKIQIGERLTKGLGVGGDHQVGQEAAEESREELRELVTGADMVFLTVGMGGGTGTGGAPIIAELAKEAEALTIGIVTRPFSFEGLRRQKVAEEGINHLLEKVDTLIIIPNDRLLAVANRDILLEDAFSMVDDVLRRGVQAITDIITVPGVINVDFADVRAVMRDGGPAWLSIGQGTGRERAKDAARDALDSPLLDVSIEGAKGVLFNITGSISQTTLHEVNEAAELIHSAVDPEANIIFGAVYDPRMENRVRLTLIATGFAAKKKPAPPKKEEMRQLLKYLEEEDKLDTPTFLRRRSTPPRQ